MFYWQDTSLLTIDICVWATSREADVFYWRSRGPAHVVISPRLFSPVGCAVPFSIFIQSLSLSPLAFWLCSVGLCCWLIWGFRRCELRYPQNSPMTRQAEGGDGAERELGAAEAADARARLSRERCFFKSIFSMWIAVVTHREENTGRLQRRMQCSSLS